LTLALTKASKGDHSKPSLCRYTCQILVAYTSLDHKKHTRRVTVPAEHERHKFAQRQYDGILMIPAPIETNAWQTRCKNSAGMGLVYARHACVGVSVCACVQYFSYSKLCTLKSRGGATLIKPSQWINSSCTLLVLTTCSAILHHCLQGSPAYPTTHDQRNNWVVGTEYIV